MAFGGAFHESGFDELVRALTHLYGVERDGDEFAGVKETQRVRYFLRRHRSAGAAQDVENGLVMFCRKRMR
jgi:hypothetical protein